MARIPADRTGYEGYACNGISPYVLYPMDCSAAGYLRLPPRSEGMLSNYSWENLSPVETSPEKEALGQLCHTDYDPFTGSFMDMRAIFGTHMPGFLEDGCYNAQDIYSKGFLNPGSPLGANSRGLNCCGS